MYPIILGTYNRTGVLLYIVLVAIVAVVVLLTVLLFLYCYMIIN